MFTPSQSWNQTDLAFLLYFLQEDEWGDAREALSGEEESASDEWRDAHEDLNEEARHVSDNMVDMWAHLAADITLIYANTPGDKQTASVVVSGAVAVS